jgi:hypothetical protein
MATRDIYNNLNDLVAFNTQSITTDTTTAGVIIDTQGYSSLLFVMQSGTLTDGTYTPSIGYVGDKRYVRLSIVSASTTSGGGGTLSAVALRGTPTIAPVA